ncbi:MAG: peptidoglycan-binding domain-containing protein [Gemmataceae bacterium]
MPLTSDHFAKQPKLEGALVADSQHIGPGAADDANKHVTKLQEALERIVQVDLSAERGRFGPRTTEAVKDFKNTRTPPLHQPWQKTADEFVGKRTMFALDAIMKEREGGGSPPSPAPIPPPKDKVELLVYFSAVVAPGGDKITGEPGGQGFRMFSPMNGLDKKEGFDKRFNGFQGSLSNNNGVALAQTFITENFEAGSRLIVYGYSAGGTNALELCRKLDAANQARKDAGQPVIEVDLLVTVDAADQFGSAIKVDRRLAGSVKKNHNFFQTNLSPRGARGGPNEPIKSAVTGRVPATIPHDMTDSLNPDTLQSRHSLIEEKSHSDALTQMKGARGG